MAADSNLNFDPNTSNVAADLQQLVKHHREATQLAGRLITLFNDLRAGDTPAGNTAIEGLVGGDTGEGANIYTIVNSLDTNLSSDEADVSKFTW